ncbi:Arc family DNA-binding protein [Acetobacter sp. TBRC 12305]|uniref:Arc family DNA-binding protein n=2 Tax=Acetobacter garciniae TaxID=2817435 RepID=A0A939HJ11_9PROT|nr:Arc family DNA-binding protein [Acetobacter garciniae]MBX0345495.1 Arc family DNA-binding protein [Acetobacter garciniae]
MQVREYAQFRVRMHPDLLSKLRNDATAGYRSLNSEIVMILEQHFADKEKAPGNDANQTPGASQK